jgi:hypothetical protein
MDYRLKENRREAFIRWYAWSLEYKDCDPAVWLTNYINKRYDHNEEQKLWLCWLYGNTYYLPTSWILMNEFPDFELATVDRITNWNTENYSRLRYQTDTKWNKGHLPSMFSSYQKFIGDKTQKEVLESYYGDNEQKSFDNLFKVIKTELHKFGRYSTWFYLQHLAQTASIELTPTSLFLSDFEGSKSHRNGLLLALSKDDLLNERLSPKEYQELETEATQILIEMNHRFPNLTPDLFTMETALCSFKKLFRISKGRYLGYYLDRQSEEISKCQSDKWNGIDWNVLWQARNESLHQSLSNKSTIQKQKFSTFLNQGNLDNLNMMFPSDKKILNLESFL